eukprot:6300104-Heterocapsa_arctica.AAC.1
MCLTCSARDPSSGYNKEEYDIQHSGMLQYWTDMTARPNFKDWDTPENIDKLCANIATQPEEDIKELSRMVAVRMTRNEVLEFMHSKTTTKGYHTRMVCVNGPKEYSLAYIMYEEMGAKIYAMALESCIKDAAAIWTNQTMKGRMT